MIIFMAITGFVILLALAHFTVKRRVNRIQNNDDTYPLAVLAAEPEGEELFIARPDGTHIRAISAGRPGPTVVLAHGYGVSLLEWNVIWQLLLEAGYRVIAFDLRGHGRSTIGADGLGSEQMAADYQAVLEYFDVRDAILVGHSTGGFLAIVFALNFPEIARQRLRGMVLFASTAGDVLRGAPQNRVQIPLIQSGLLQKIIGSRTYGSAFVLSLMGDDPSPAVIEAFLQLFRNQPHRMLVPILQALARENCYPRLGEIHLPCVVICGEKDKSTPSWHSQKLGTDIPDAFNIWVKGKGHLLNWEAPEALLDAVHFLSPQKTRRQTSENSVPSASLW